MRVQFSGDAGSKQEILPQGSECSRACASSSSDGSNRSRERRCPRVHSYSFTDLIFENDELHRRVVQLEQGMAKFGDPMDSIVAADVQDSPRYRTSSFARGIDARPRRRRTSAVEEAEELDRLRTSRVRLLWRLAVRCAMLSSARDRRVHAATRSLVTDKDTELIAMRGELDKMRAQSAQSKRQLKTERAAMEDATMRLKAEKQALASERKQLEDQIAEMASAHSLATRSRALTANLMSQLSDCGLEDDSAVLRSRLRQALAAQEDLAQKVSSLQELNESLSAQLAGSAFEQQALVASKREFEAVIAKPRPPPECEDSRPADLWPTVAELRRELGITQKELHLWKTRASETWMNKFLGAMCTSDGPARGSKEQRPPEGPQANA